MVNLTKVPEVVVFHYYYRDEVYS